MAIDQFYNDYIATVLAREHLKEVPDLVRTSKIVMALGGGAKIRGFLEAKKRWSGDSEFRDQDQSSLLGAAMLGQFYQSQKYA